MAGDKRLSWLNPKNWARPRKQPARGLPNLIDTSSPTPSPTPAYTPFPAPAPAAEMVAGQNTASSQEPALSAEAHAARPPATPTQQSPGLATSTPPSGSAIQSVLQSVNRARTFTQECIAKSDDQAIRDRDRANAERDRANATLRQVYAELDQLRDAVNKLSTSTVQANIGRDQATPQLDVADTNTSVSMIAHAGTRREEADQPERSRNVAEEKDDWRQSYLRAARAV